MTGVDVAVVRELWGRVPNAEPDLLLAESPEQEAYLRDHVSTSAERGELVGLWWSKDAGESATQEEIEDLTRHAFVGPMVVAMLAVGAALAGTLVHGWLRWTAWIAAGAFGAGALWSFGVAIVWRLVADAMEDSEEDR